MRAQADYSANMRFAGLSMICPDWGQQRRGGDEDGEVKPSASRLELRVEPGPETPHEPIGQVQDVRARLHAAHVFRTRAGYRKAATTSCIYTFTFCPRGKRVEIRMFLT